jgi:hypothetical protein
MKTFVLQEKPVLLFLSCAFSVLRGKFAGQTWREFIRAAFPSGSRHRAASVPIFLVALARDRDSYLVSRDARCFGITSELNVSARIKAEPVDSEQLIARPCQSSIKYN